MSETLNGIQVPTFVKLLLINHLGPTFSFLDRSERRRAREEGERTFREG